MSKKLLNEASVRRFMGLAGMKAGVVSNTISEMYGKSMEYGKPMEDEEEKEAVHQEAMDVEEEDEAADPVEDEPAMDAAPEMPAEEPMEGGPEMEISSEEADVLAGVLEKLLAAKGEDAPMDDEPEAEEEMMEMDDPKEEKEEKEMMEQALSEVDLELDENEIVQEVARRVAKRILEAKAAKKKLDEALGK